MANKGVKQLLLGLTVVLFSLMLVLAAVVLLLIDAVPYLVNAGRPSSEGAVVLVFFAFIAGIGGLVLAFAGIGRAD